MKPWGHFKFSRARGLRDAIGVRGVIPWVTSGEDFVEYRPPVGTPVLSSLRIGLCPNDYLQFDQ
jgi:hypothetical protein